MVENKNISFWIKFEKKNILKIRLALCDTKVLGVVSRDVRVVSFSFVVISNYTKLIK